MSHITTHHSQQDFSIREISSSQRPLPDNTQHYRPLPDNTQHYRPLPDNTQHSQRISTTPAGFEPTFSEFQQPYIYTLDRGATGIGSSLLTSPFTSKLSPCYIFLNTNFTMERFFEYLYIFTAMHLRLPSFCDMTPRHWMPCYKCFETG